MLPMRPIGHFSIKMMHRFQVLSSRYRFESVLGENIQVPASHSFRRIHLYNIVRSGQGIKIRIIFSLIFEANIYRRSVARE